jgi:Zn-dependent peptidase ImmA (M78 family)
MVRTNEAFVTPEVLVWARVVAHVDLEVAAKRATVSVAKLEAWERGESNPTLRQARLLAAAYRQPFAAFFLPTPPAFNRHIPKDYRRLAGTQQQELSSAVQQDVIRSWELRDIALELLAERGEALPEFAISGSLNEDPEVVGDNLRAYLGVSREAQFSWKDSRRGFNEWRERCEKAGLLVLQTSDIPLSECRAYSLFASLLPVIVLNRKDVPAARSFSLIHEAVHLVLHSEGICDLSSDIMRSPEEQALEVFCNAASAACLMPRGLLRSHPIVTSRTADPLWEEPEIQALARAFSVSREALLRRLLTLGLTTRQFYEMKRAQYVEEYNSQPKKDGFIAPAQDAVSLLGKPFVRLVLDSLESGSITTSDASEYLGVRLKHLAALSSAIEIE